VSVRTAARGCGRADPSRDAGGINEDVPLTIQLEINLDVV
jgi:hypothetical protein